MHPPELHKYPRTRHIEGSRLQPGDQDLEQVPWSSLADQWLVIEEKIDGANAGISFDSDGRLFLQSRGHFLTGGAREKHFALFKTWAARHRESLREILGSRYLMYGEWVFAKHTLFYDRLPHYFLEFDVFDRDTEEFLDTDRRQEMLRSTPVVSVPVLRRGTGRSLPRPGALVARALYKGPRWRDRLRQQALEHGLDVERVVSETDPADEAEGLYVKVEADGRVVDRLKWIRPGFLTAVKESETHWLNRPIVPNMLRDDVDLFRA